MTQTTSTSAQGLRFVFDDFPSPEGARFIEVEDHNGRSINAGEWRRREDGLVELVVSVSASPSPAASPASPSGDAVHEALREAEAAFETIRVILINELDEPVRRAFWRAVEARDSLRALHLGFPEPASLASDATPAPTSGSEDGGDWRPVLTEMVAAMNRYGHDIGDGDIPSAHRSLMWRAEQLLAKPAASPASPSGVLDLYREAVRIDVNMEGPQFMGCNTSALKRAWEADRASLASDATPAPTMDEGERVKWLEGCLATANKRADEYEALYEEFHDRALAKPASAGGDVREALRWVEQNLAAAKRAMKTSAEHSDGRSNFAAHDAHKHLSTIAAALSSPAGPAVEAVAWRWRFLDDKPSAPWSYTTKIEDVMGIDIQSQPLYAHPAPATVEMLHEAAKAGWNACRKSLYAVCEDVDREADDARKVEGEHAKGYAAGMARAAKSIARGFGAINAEDDDNFTAAVAALAPATEGRKS